MPLTGGMYSFWPVLSSLPVRLFDQIMLLEVTLNFLATLATVSPARTIYVLISLFDLKAEATTCGLLTRLSDAWTIANSAFSKSAWLVTAVASGKLVIRATLTAISADDNWSSGSVGALSLLAAAKTTDLS